MQPLMVNDFLTSINELKVLIKERLSDDSYESVAVDKISEAFANAQLEYLPILKNCSINGKAYSFKYASLEEILNTIRPSISKHGLSFHQFTKESPANSVLMLHSRLRHASGQWFESRMRVIVAGEKLQDLGEALTYYRRYSALLLLGHHPEDEDADGSVDVNARKRDVERFVNSDPVKTNLQKPKSYERVNQTELDDLENELATHPDMAIRLKQQLNLNRLSDMAKEDYRPIITKIREHKLELNKVRNNSSQ